LFGKIKETSNNIFNAKFHRSVSLYIYIGVTISPKKKKKKNYGERALRYVHPRILDVGFMVRVGAKLRS